MHLVLRVSMKGVKFVRWRKTVRDRFRGVGSIRQSSPYINLSAEVWILRCENFNIKIDTCNYVT